MRNVLLIIAFLSSTIAFSQNGEKNYIDQNFIEVTGKAEMKISPDKIFISVQLNEKDYKNKASLTESENKMLKTLEEIGIDISKDLFVKDISSNFKYYLLTRNKILLSKDYQILVRESKLVSKVFIELEKVGISNISIEKLENSEIEEYRKEVKINAIKAAREKAEYLAKAINQDIGRAIFISENVNVGRTSWTPQNSNSIMIRGSSSIYGSKAADIDIDFEKIKLEYTILCKFELK